MTEAWAIKAPNGLISATSIESDKYMSIKGFSFSADDWQRKLDEGYRCVRVRIVEVE